MNTSFIVLDPEIKTVVENNLAEKGVLTLDNVISLAKKAYQAGFDKGKQSATDSSQDLIAPLDWNSFSSSLQDVYANSLDTNLDPGVVTSLDKLAFDLKAKKLS